MAFRKFGADNIFDGIAFRQGWVLITDEEGGIVDLVPEKDAGNEIQFFPGMLTPGFINCHCHLELSHLKGLIPEKTGLVDFVLKVVTLRHHAESTILKAIEQAENEMWSNGIVAVGDICNNNLSVEQKKGNRISYHNFIELSGWQPGIADERMNRAQQLCETFTSLPHPCSIVPHAPYSVSERLWNVLKPVMEGRIITMHNQESRDENILFEKGEGDFLRLFNVMGIQNTHHLASGKSSLQTVFSYLASARKLLLVHNSFTQEGDLDFLSACNDQEIFFCLCPNANLYIESQLPPVDLFIRHDLNLVLGTDSLASNHQLDILAEIRTIRKAFPQITLEEIFRWATLNGAKALGMDEALGSFEKNKKPGILQINEKEWKVKRLL